MAQSLRAIKRFRVRELAPASQTKSRPPPAATAASNLRPLAPAREGPTSPSRSDTALNPFVPHKNEKSGRWAPPKYSLRRQAELVKHARASGTLHLLPPGPKMNSAQLQQQVAAAAAASSSFTPTTSTSSSSSPSILGKDFVGEAETVVVVGNGLVSLRRGQVVQVQVQGQGPRQAREEGAGRQAPALGQESLDAHAEWARDVEWVGTVRERNVAGADVGNRLYAGKKRMFKGHKWERVRERRVARTRMLLRDMDKRVQRFKGVRYSKLFHSHPPR